MQKVNADFRDKAPLSAAQAAAIILDGVQSGAWRILVGEDAAIVDEDCSRTCAPERCARSHKASMIGSTADYAPTRKRPTGQLPCGCRTDIIG